MHPLLEICYLKIYIYYLRCYGYMLFIYGRILMAYIPILRTLLYINGYAFRILRDSIFHIRVECMHLLREWRAFRRKVQQAVQDSVLTVLPDASRLKIPKPPVPHLLSSNEAPNDLEIESIKSAIQRAREERLRLKAELFLGKATKQSDLVWETVTRHKISSVSTFIDQHEGIISPLRRLPPEILQHIFHFAIPSCTNVPRTWKTAHDVPWVLGQVCRSWRKTALSYSRLWCCFPKLELRITRSRIAIQLKMLKELLNRSGIAPLNICVNALPETYCMRSHPTLDLLTKSSERWVVAAFALSLNLSRSLEIVKGRLPLLEKLFVHDHIELGAQSLRFDTFRIAPRLRAVNTSAIHHFDLPVDQLISFKVEISGIHFSQQILASPKPCPLENLTILELLDPQSVVPVTLPRLVKLSARFWASRDTSVLQKFTLPAIEHIRILCSEPNALLTNLLGMLSNCKDREGTLKRLYYRIPDPVEEGFSDLLALVPNLVELDANLPKPENIQHLIDGFMGRDLVPLLDICRFYVKKDQVGDTVADLLNRLAESRCELVGADIALWDGKGREDGSSAFHFPDDVRPLRSLLLYSDDQNTVHSLNGTVNGYDPTPTYKALAFAGIQLSKAVELSNRNRPRRNMPNPELDTVLDSIEKINVQNVQDIYFSGLHLGLKQLRNWKKKGKDKYTQRAQQILEQWEPRFRTNWGTRKWVLKGHFCVSYIGRKDPLRTSSRNMEIAYEVTPPMMILEVLWPHATLRDSA